MRTLKQNGMGLALGSLIATITAVAAVDFEDFYGAALAGFCERPCSDTYLATLLECGDWNGQPPPCDLTVCFLNTERYICCSSTVGAEAQCNYQVDNNQWARWMVVRQTNCVNNGPSSFTYAGCCGEADFNGISTPCGTSECTGTLVQDGPQAMGRTVCVQ
jgi:hypothetical protein